MVVLMAALFSPRVSSTSLIILSLFDHFTLYTLFNSLPFSLHSVCEVLTC